MLRTALLSAVALASLAILSLALPLPALAGENNWLGAIISDGGTASNWATTTPFPIPPGAKVTMVCTAAANILTDRTKTSNGTTGDVKGLPITANTIFPTSVGKGLVQFGDGGTGALVSSGLIAVMGTASSTLCDVWIRQGGE